MVPGMGKSGYAAFIDECRRERDSLLGIIKAMEEKRLGTGMPITIPATMNQATINAVAGFKRSVAELNTLIAAYEAEPHA
jgi:hypothetical protein